MSLKGVIEPLLPDECYISVLESCEQYYEIFKKGRGKKRRLVGHVYESKVDISVNVTDPKIKKHVQTMVLITGSPVVVVN